MRKRVIRAGEIEIEDSEGRVRARFGVTNEDLPFLSFYGPDEKLRARYGVPKDAQALWEDDATQEERMAYLLQDRATPDAILPSDRGVGLAVSLGHLKIFTEWVTSQTRTIHSLSGENGRIMHQVEYRSVSAAPRRP